MNGIAARAVIPDHATDEPTVGAYAYHYGGLGPVIVTEILFGGYIKVDLRGLILTVPAKNYMFATFDHQEVDWE